jgi:hypothetical protein
MYNTIAIPNNNPNRRRLSCQIGKMFMYTRSPSIGNSQIHWASRGAAIHIGTRSSAMTNNSTGR